jgi:MFS family permease
MSEDIQNLQKMAPHRRLWNLSLDRRFAPLIMYSMIMFLLVFGDATMAYVTPVYIESHVQNSLIMGIVMSFSSLIGFCCDLTFPSVFRSKDNLFFLGGTIVCAILFPLIYLFLPAILPTLLLGVGIWGVYYEFLSFSNFNFIHAYLKQEHHALAWGILSTFKSLGIFVAPLLASELLHENLQFPFFAALGFFCAGIFGTLIFTHVFPRNKHPHVVEEVRKPFRVFEQLKVWWVLLRKIWPVYIFIFVLFILDSTYWTIGILLSEEIQQRSHIGSFLLMAYILPSLFMGALIHKMAKPFGKKRLAFIAGGAAGLILLVTGLSPSPLLLLMGIFCSSLFTAAAFPAIMAVIQDYVGRLENHRGDMVGLQASASSLSYIIGPITAGGIATLVGTQHTFSIMGGLLLAISLLCLIVVPRKIHLPQNGLQTLAGI